MVYEYRQVRYRASEGRFDGSLNKMAGQGWRVESIDRMDDLFLVTYSRQTHGGLKVDQCAEGNLSEVLEANRKVGNRLVDMVGTTQRPNNDFLYTLVWEVQRPGQRQPRFRTYSRGA